jgi:multimeric flavodoxin WrbA
MYIVITSSPNSDGLTAACGQAVIKGLDSASAKAEHFNISEAKLKPCLICNDGWGSCLKTNKCVIGDLLDDIQKAVKEAQGVFLVTPVYFWQPSERMKYFLDRFRRCEAFRRSGSWAAGKQFSLIAAAGGSGNGTAPCLEQMEQWVRHVKGIPQERLGVTRFNAKAMLKVIEDAGERMATGEYFKELSLG